MHVLHVMESTIGGTRRHLVDVAAGQRASGLDVSLAVAAEREPLFRGDLERLARLGCRVIEVPMRRSLSPRSDLAHLRRLARLMTDLRPDVVHTHSSKAGVLGRLASLQADVGARVHTPHTLAFLFRAMFGPLKRRLFREIEAQLAGATLRMVAVSATEAETFRASGVVPTERVRVVSNGIDPRPWLAARPVERAALGVPPGVPLVAVCGLLTVAKGQDVLLRALALNGGDVHALVVGRGEEREALERLAQTLGIADRVHFLGWREDLPPVLAACDALVLPSRWEGMPYIVLEAMAAGLPVVATRVDGARELVADGETGYLVPIEDPAALGAALVRLFRLDPDERAQHGRAGRERVLGRFTSEHMVAGLSAVYREILP